MYMNESPFFSVIIPVHNKLPHLERSINSVLNQTYKNFEIILIDDASTDGSSQKLATFIDPKITLLKRSAPGPGGYAARNLGIKNAKYEWVCFLDADDEWKLELLDTIKTYIIENKNIECVTWGWYSVNAKSKALNLTSQLNSRHTHLYFTLIEFFNQKHSLWTGAVALKKDLLLRSGGFPEVGYKRGGDVDTWIRCLWNSKGNIWINKTLSYYYLDSVNMVTKLTKRETLYFFSPFLQKILDTSTDKALIRAVKSFQNERIYSTIRGQFIDRHPADYSLIRRMNYSNDYIVLLFKLLYNKIKYSIKNLLSLSSKKQRQLQN
jgi:glycosyltransferase involved in cell wall biosynthesis